MGIKERIKKYDGKTKEVKRKETMESKHGARSGILITTPLLLQKDERAENSPKGKQKIQ